MSSIKAMTEAELRAVAPSIFADKPHKSRSDKYAYVPTIDVLGRLRKAGYVPTEANQSRIRIPREGKPDVARIQYMRHMIRLRDRRQLDVDPKSRKVGDVVPEIILINSHDGSSSFRLDAGLYRLACSNGLIVKSADFGSIILRHQGEELLAAIVEAANDIAERMPKIMDITKAWDKIHMTNAAATRFAKAALDLRYATNSPIDAAAALTPRRSQDEGDTLWKHFNVLQENLSKGGLEGRSAVGRHVHTRAIQSVNNVLHFNRGLWELAEGIAARA
jgi:hypothetical protein